MNKIYVYSGWLEQPPLIGIYTVDRTRNSASFAYDADGSLWIAKFPSRHDDMNVGAWEQTAYKLAQRLISRC